MNSETFSEEGTLWCEFKNSNPKAFKYLYESYFTTLNRYGMRLDADQALVQDAIHDLFLDLWRMRKNLSETVSIQYYLCRSLRRRIHVNSKNKFQNLEDSHESLLQTEYPESQLIRDELSLECGEYLFRSLNGLSKREKEVVVMKYYRNKTVKEVASQLSIKEQTVRNLIYRALCKLRKNITETLVYSN
jgi:RNA polymerase sigma-70 factor (ECF subfamily)